MPKIHCGNKTYTYPYNDKGEKRALTDFHNYHRFHYGHYYEQRYKEEPKRGIINIAGLELTFEQLWEELTDRLALAKKLMLERIRDDDLTEDR